jgi:hypothetical protein
MSSPWHLLRTVVVADIASEPAFEANQVALPADFGVAYPRDRVADTGDSLQEIELMVLGYDGAVGSDGYSTGNIVSGTCTLQVVEVAPHPNANVPDRLMYTGRTPVAALPTGRQHVFNARYLHGFTAVLSTLGGGLAGAVSIEILWRTYR